MRSGERPSSRWPPLQQALSNYDGRERDRYTEFFATLPWKNITNLVSSTRTDGVAFSFTQDNYTWGQFSLVIEICFDDGSFWVLRLRMPPASWQTLDVEAQARSIRREVAAIRLVQEKTTIPVPRVYAAEMTKDNPIGHPYVLQEAIIGFDPKEVGLDLINDGHMSPEIERRLENYITQLAEYHLQLSTIRFSQIGALDVDERGHTIIRPYDELKAGPFSTPLDYYVAQADTLVTLALSVPDQSPAQVIERLFVAYLWRSALTIVDRRSTDTEAETFPLAHGDLHPGNTLVDEDGNIVAFMDWDCAGTVPITTFAVPWFSWGYRPSTRHAMNRSHRIHMFNEALSHLEKKYYPHVNIQSPNSLTSLYRSPEAVVVSTLPWMLTGMDCDFMFAEDLCSALYGEEAKVEDIFKMITSSPLFQRFYDSAITSAPAIATTVS